MSSYKVLLMVTSHARLGFTKEATGVDLVQFAICHAVLEAQGIHVTTCSIKGGMPPIDPLYNIDGADRQLAASRDALLGLLASSKRISHVNPMDYDAVIVCGGYGALWDLTCDPDSVTLLDNFHSSDKYICAFGHASGALIHVTREDDSPMLTGKKVTGCSNSEELAGNRGNAIPFSVEDELVRCGSIFTQADNGQPHVVVDGWLITGQNTASVRSAVDALVNALNQ
ncbi:type 1 glutamine amidotransferase domain-containing protein [Vibrio cionasavignyae]|uniref:type 1 glutamine amidotransferase domain-containing protein n=1 Tax=Vibrio cionasavignyae TaxID=2910252 RepID=UPI003D14D875